MIGLCCNEKYSAMTNYDDRDDDEYGDRKKDGNNNDNSTSRLVSNGPIFDTITTPQSRGGGLKKK